jgi:hypothetical protein
MATGSWKVRRWRGTDALIWSAIGPAGLSSGWSGLLRPWSSSARAVALGAWLPPARVVPVSRWHGRGRCGASIRQDSAGAPVYLPARATPTPPLTPASAVEGCLPYAPEALTFACASSPGSDPAPLVFASDARPSIWLRDAELVVPCTDFPGQRPGDGERRTSLGETAAPCQRQPPAHTVCPMVLGSGTSRHAVPFAAAATTRSPIFRTGVSRHAQSH